MEFSNWFLSCCLHILIHFCYIHSLESRRDEANSKQIDNLIHDSYYCPVSSRIKTNEDGFHSYPVDIYDPQTYYKLLASGKSKTIYLCDSRYSKEPFHCSTSTRCPVSAENIEEMISDNKINTWEYKHSFCTFSKIFKNQNAKSNILVLGGSVTAGTSAKGCCCNEKLDPKCSKFANKLENCEAAVASDCSWPAYLHRWMKQVALGDVNVINMARGGFTSPYMAENFISQYNELGLSALTSNDIVILDHSVNDGECLTSTDERHTQLLEGLDTLVRLIYSTSKPNSWPTIILLETWPYGTIERRPNSEKFDPPYDYQKVYRQIAKMYNLPVWSYRDMIWSAFASTNMTAFYDEVRFYRSIHPSWHVNLFFADIIAFILQKEAESCDTGKSKSRIRRSSDMVLSNFPKFNSSTTKYCAENKKPIFEISAMDKNAHSISYTSVPDKVWSLVEDAPGKKGWLTEKTKMSTVILDTYKDHKYSSKLVFPFVPDSDFYKKKSLIRIHYMRTYANAGMVDVFLCGQYLTTLDALWEDWHTYHFTFNQIFTFEYNPKLKPLCTKGDKDAMTIEVKRYHDVTSSKDEKQYKNARSRNKFKLVAFEVCEES